MGRENIFNTFSMATVVQKSTLNDLIDFLISNRNYILPVKRTTDVFKTRSMGNSIISDIVNRLVSSEKEKEYSLIKFPNKGVPLREVFDMSFIPFDIRQIKDVLPDISKALTLIPELKDKMIINITDLTRANGDFSDISQFHYRVVRNFLSRSFYVSKGSSWISPAFVRYIAKVYNMTIGGKIARLFNLSPPIQMFVQTIFCLFFVAKMTSVSAAQSFIKSNAKQLGINLQSDLQQIFNFVEDTINKQAPESLFEVLTIIDAYDHDQLKNGESSRLTLPVLNTRFSSMYQEGHLSIIALEYPPYFAFLILLVLSNIRIGLSFDMKNLNLVKEGRDIIDQILRSPSFVNGI